MMRVLPFKSWSPGRDLDEYRLRSIWWKCRTQSAIVFAMKRTLKDELRLVLRDYDDSAAALTERLLHSETPGSIFAARLHFNKARNRRSRILRDDVIPALRRARQPDGQELADAIAQHLSHFDELYSVHIRKWGLAEVEEDWPGYREESIALLRACQLVSHEEYANGRIEALLDSSPSGPFA